MTPDQADQLYRERLARYVAAMRNTTPDRVPIRPFAAEVAARSAGFTCQDVTQDYRQAFEAVIRCAKEYSWDAAVPNMVAWGTPAHMATMFGTAASHEYSFAQRMTASNAWR